MGVKLAAASGGSIELVPTNTASAFTVTVPASTGTMAMDGPAFSAYRSTAQALTGGVNTKLAFDTKEFDTNTNYDNTTNYRFTPTVSGYYQVSAGVAASAVATIQVSVFKNGSAYKIPFSSNSASVATGGASCLVFCNGSTDYVEIYAGFSASLNAVAGIQYTFFQASMVRGA